MTTATDNGVTDPRARFAGAVLRVVLATALILLAPFTAMQFTDEVAWDGADFIAAAALLGGTGLLYVFLTWKVTRVRWRRAIGLALAAALLLVWLELAVGIVGAGEQAAAAPASADRSPAYVG